MAGMWEIRERKNRKMMPVIRRIHTDQEGRLFLQKNEQSHENS